MILMYLFIMGFSALTSGADEYTYQQYIGCAFNRDGQVGHLWRYGYNGKDLMHVDLGGEAMVATSEAGNFLVEERNNRLYFKTKEMRLMKVCSAVQTVFSLSNSSLSRAAKPTVHVSLGGEEGHEYLLCSVRGFYPNVIRVRWTLQGKPLYYGTTTTGILPHKDGTFQMTSYLTLGNTSAHGITCETEHISIQGKMKMVFEEERHLGLSVAISMVALALAFLLPVSMTGLIICVKRKRNLNSVNDSNEESESPPSMSLMNLQLEE